MATGEYPNGPTDITNRRFRYRCFFSGVGLPGRRHLNPAKEATDGGRYCVHAAGAARGSEGDINAVSGTTPRHGQCAKR